MQTPPQPLSSTSPNLILITTISLIILLISILYYHSIKITIPLPPKKSYYSSLIKNYTILSWESSYEKAKKFLEPLPLKYKISLLYGTDNMLESSQKNIGCVGKLDPFFHKESNTIFNGMCLNDGPTGVRFSNGTSISWNSPLNTACTFDKKLVYKIGKIQGMEFYEKGINTILSPNLNIMRSPLSGRVWEGFGDDPYLISIMGTLFVKGIQDSGVIANAKHYVGNDQETYRRCSNSIIDERNLWENYLRPFIHVIKYGDVGSVMTSYNAVNGIYLSKNRKLVLEYLKEKIGFKGFVVTDWWAIYDSNPDYINSGVDMNMPGGKAYGKKYTGRDRSYWSYLENYVRNEKVKEKRIDDAALRIIATMYKFNQMDNFNSVNFSRNTNNDENIKFQRKVAADSNVLLKNEDNILPINDKIVKKIAILGSDAFERDCPNERDFNCYTPKNPHYKGHSPIGYGSGTTTFKYLITPYEGILKRAKKSNIKVVSHNKLTEKGEEDIKTSIQISKDSDIILIFAHSISGEEYIRSEGSCGDRFSLTLLHNIDSLIIELSKINKNIIVIINSPGPVNLPWKDKVKGIIFSGYPGSESGNGIADILFGDVNPSGHLPFVWSKREDYCCDIIKTKCNETEKFRKKYRYNGSPNMEEYKYSEGLFIGQRWFDLKRIKPIFNFGYGLSYTKFTFKNLNAEMKESGLFVNVTVINEGNVDGSSVVLIFLTFPNYVSNFPIRVFKGFEKVFVKKGESVICHIFVDDFSLSYYSVEVNDFVRPKKGEFVVFAGSSAGIEDLKLSVKVKADF